MSIQTTAWGQIEWLTADSTAASSQAMTVGIMTIRGHARHERHVHYESEQFIYILQGDGIDVINDKPRAFHSGAFYYLPPNITHELINTGDQDILYLLVSVSTVFNEPPFDEAEIESFSSSFYGAAEAIRSQITETASLPVAIFDDMGNLVLQNNKYPQYCIEHCHPSIAMQACPCFSGRSEASAAIGNTKIVCPYGLTVFCLPIRYQKRFLGSIFSGHILLGSESSDADIHMYDSPRSTTLAIQTWMANISKTLVHFCSFDALRQSLSQKDSLLAQKQRDQQLLEADLQAMRNTVTNLKINHHFLYNTLNAIACQALSGDSVTTYQCIVDLAKMFRYSTVVGLQLVPLEFELEYLNTYLHMQKLRYAEGLTINLDCKDGIRAGQVPFNFLQPIIENVFTHGFADYAGEKRLDVRISRVKDQLCFLIGNNGSIIDRVTLKRVQMSMEGNSGHGLSLVYSKLQATYGNAFTIQISSGKKCGTQVRISIPYRMPETEENG